MFIFKNNFKCFKLHVCIKYAKIINLPQIFKFSSENNNEQIKPKIVPKIIQKIRKEDINNKANDIRKRDDSKQRKEKKPVVPKEDKNGEQKPNKEKAKDKENKPKPSIKKTEPMRTDVRGDVQPYFLNKSKEEDLDPKSFSVAKLMEYNSLERRNKIKHIETTLILNKDLTKEMPKSEIKKKLSITKEELVRELPKHLFRLGMKSEEMSYHSPLVQQAMGLHNASIGEMRKARILEIRRRFSKHERDTASPAITASVLCENVIHNLNHLKLHKNDMSAFIKLKHYLTKRRKYLRYLKHKDPNAYCFIVKYYGIKDIDDAMAKSFKRMLRI